VAGQENRLKKVFGFLAADCPPHPDIAPPGGTWAGQLLTYNLIKGIFVYPILFSDFLLEDY
jgi:hypothetical protein